MQNYTSVLTNYWSNVKNIIFISCFLLLLLSDAFNPAGMAQYKVRKVVIDAGHGGKDPGTHGKVSNEKDVTLAIALELGRTINKYLPDVEVIQTRTTDEYSPPHVKAEIANKNDADLFISIHANASAHSGSVHGTETYVMGTHTFKENLAVAKRENSVILMEENYEEHYEGFDPASSESHILFSLYQNAYQENSLRLAEKIEKQFAQRVGRRSRGVRQAGFWVLYLTSMPSVLVEVGYLTNEEEEKFLNSERGQVYIASAIFRAFRDYKQEIEGMN